jgi:hypothetical protein
MPISIVGDGSITGLTAGGLPDGSVVDLDLATGISSSKLTGALPAISGASLTNLPAGGVAGITTASSSGTAINISSGNDVGIGVSTPEGALEIERGNYGSPFGTNAGEFADSLITLGNSTANNDLSQITFGFSGGSGAYGAAYMGFKNTNASAQGSGNLVFGTRNSAVDTVQPTERLAITPDGRGLSQFTAKAWVNFQGSATPSIRESHNVSSVSYMGTTGYYAVNFANGLATGDYPVVTHGGIALASTSTWMDYGWAKNGSYYRMTFYRNGSIYDAAHISSIVFGV